MDVLVQCTSLLLGNHPFKSFKLSIGYSSSSQMEDEEESRGSSIREHHVEEAVKMLRAISLRHNPTTMATFLQETVLEK